MVASRRGSAVSRPRMHHRCRAHHSLLTARRLFAMARLGAIAPRHAKVMAIVRKLRDSTVYRVMTGQRTVLRSVVSMACVKIIRPIAPARRAIHAVVRRAVMRVSSARPQTEAVIRAPAIGFASAKRRCQCVPWQRHEAAHRAMQLVLAIATRFSVGRGTARDASPLLAVPVWEATA